MTEADGRRRGWLVPTLFTLVCLAVLIGLGKWQLDRKAWKEDLIATLDHRLSAAPASMPVRPQWTTLDATQLEYRRVAVPVEFLYDREALVYTSGSAFRPDIKGAGYWVLTPARLPGGSIVVVNRGFVPQELKDPAQRARGNVGGTVDIVGVMRWPEPRGTFTPDDDSQHNVWYVRDPVAIAKAKDWGTVAPFMLDLESPQPPGGWPRAGRLVVKLTNNHWQYALTWFGLALTLAGVYLALMIGRLRR